MNALALLNELLFLQSEGHDLSRLDVVTVQSHWDEAATCSYENEGYPSNVEVSGTELRLG